MASDGERTARVRPSYPFAPGERRECPMCGSEGECVDVPASLFICDRHGHGWVEPTPRAGAQREEESA